MSDRLKELSAAGVSIWLDDLSRERITSGNLAELVSGSSVVGVTTNPTIFAGALADGEAYAAQVSLLAETGTSVAEAITAITTDDVRSACDLFAATYAATEGVDGRVSIEVEPGLAMDTDATVAQAKELYDMVGRPNVLIKIPATKPGLPAITQTIAQGISVNVTLIFGLERYREVIDAYLTGLEQAKENGHDLSTIHSVASFFVSRVDVEVDQRLDAIGTDHPDLADRAAALKGKAAVANARLAYQLFGEVDQAGSALKQRWDALAAQGANPQRPLWASTGVKNPDYADTMYVTELVVTDTVNTMPEKTMQAFADHGDTNGDQVSTMYDVAAQVMSDLAAVGVDMNDVVQVLEEEGVQKFDDSWSELVETVKSALADSVPIGSSAG